MNHKKQFLATMTLAISTHFACTAVIFAEEVKDLEEKEASLTEEIVVEARKYEIPGNFVDVKGNVGFLGTKDLMEVPFQQSNLTEKTLETFQGDPSQGSTSILVNAPSIRTNSSTLYHDFSIRGQKADAYQFRINGIPGLLSQTNMPLNFAESISITSGPGVGMNGVAAKESPGGVINILTKRAGKEDLNRYTLSFGGRSSWGHSIDISRRFGTNKEHGLRINAAYISGGTAIPGEDVTQKNIFINYDRTTDHGQSNLFFGHRDTLAEGAQRYFDFSNQNITKMPKAPNNKNNYAFDGEKLGMKTTMVTFNHTQKVSSKTQLFLNTGYAYNDGYDYQVPASSRLDVINDQGDFRRTINNEPFAIRNGYLQLGVRQDWQVGSVKNNFVLAWDKDWYSARWGVSSSNKGTVTGNIHTGNVSIDKMTENLYGPQRSGRVQYYGWSGVNTSTIGKLDVLLGIHRHTSSATSALGDQTKTSANSPLFGVVYRPNSKVSLFANHSESFHQGKVVGNNYANKGEVLSPAKTKSNEIGIKYDHYSLMTSLSFFSMKQEAEFTDVESNRLTLDGDLKYQGVELSVAGKVASKWNLMGGLMYLNSEYQKNDRSFYNGKSIMGTADWSAVLMLEYEASKQFSLWGRMVYTGKAPVYTSGNRKLEIPSFAVFDVGMKYRTKINRTPVTLQAIVFNVFDRDYWMARPTYNFAILGNPRTFALSAQFDF